jgi:hypothetical protein
MFLRKKTRINATGAATVSQKSETSGAILQAILFAGEQEQGELQADAQN